MAAVASRKCSLDWANSRPRSSSDIRMLPTIPHAPDALHMAVLAPRLTTQVRPRVASGPGREPAVATQLVAMTDLDDRPEHIAALYAQHAARLRQLVRRRVRTDDQNIEDACAFAWTTLIDRPDVDPTEERTRGWLYTVAANEAVHLHQRQNDHFHADHPATDDPQHISHASNPADLVDHRETLRLIDELPQRQQRILWRQLAGFTYDEIGEQEGISQTATNAQVAKAKRNLRAIEAVSRGEEDPDSPSSRTVAALRRLHSANFPSPAPRGQASTSPTPTRPRPPPRQRDSDRGR